VEVGSNPGGWNRTARVKRPVERISKDEEEVSSSSVEEGEQGWKSLTRGGFPGPKR